MENEMEYEISFACDSCRREIVAPSSLAGSEISCPECGARTQVPIPGLVNGLELGEFVLICKIGSGGMGEVWLAEQQTLHRKVALKILQPQLAANERFIRRFLSEAHMSGKLEHPSIVMAYSAGQIGSFYYLATSYIDGVELNNRLKAEYRLPEREALKIAKCVAEALRYAWNEHRMVHRDIKPANIMIDAYGNPRLMDFGISKIISVEKDAAQSDDLCGTPEYIYPEQIRGRSDIDFRCDIYSLGITLCQLVSGLLPFRGTTVEETLKMHLNVPFPRQSLLQSGISSQCCRLIEIMTAKDPEDRHSSWDYVIADIDLVLDGKTPVGRIAADPGEPGKFAPSAPNARISMKSARPTSAEQFHVHDRPHSKPTVQAPVKKTPEPPSDTTGVTMRPLNEIPPKIQFQKIKKKSIIPRIIAAMVAILLLLLVILIVILLK